MLLRRSTDSTTAIAARRLAQLGRTTALIELSDAGSDGGTAPVELSDAGGDGGTAPVELSDAGGDGGTAPVELSDAGGHRGTSRAAAVAADPPTAPARAGRWRRLLPGAMAGARVDPERRGVAAIAFVAVVFAVAAAVFAWRARPQLEPVAAVRPVVDVSAPSTPSELVVAVSGAVQRPGLVRVPAGARVADAIAAAGGVLPGQGTGVLNLARKVVDGELVLVGPAAPGEAPPAAGSADGPLLDLNTATVSQVDALPGVGPVLAQRIIDHRTRRGAFRSVEQLREIEGIGDARFQRLRDLVTV